MDTDTPDTAPAAAAADAASPSGLRRRLVGAGLIGLTGALLPGIASGAAASPDQTTTTAPPKRPSEADLALLRFAQSAELTAHSLLTTALATGLGEITASVVSRVRDAHLAFAQALAAEIGRTAPGAPDEALVGQFEAAFSGSQQSILDAAVELENTLVATHTEVMGQLEGTDGAKLVASFVIAEARHAVAFADLAGAASLDDYLVNDAAALAPAEG